MARAHIGVRQLDAARGMLDRALALDEEFAPAHAELGVLLDLRGQHRAAEKHHRRAIVLEPDVASHRNNLGFCMYLQGRYREAVYAYRAALERDAGRRRIHNNLGFAYGQLGAMEAAYRHFRRAGRPAQASNNMGYVLETKGELERAYDYYLIALSQDPNLVQARRNLERVCSRLGRPVPPLDVQSPTQQREPLPAPEVGPAPAAPAASMDRQS
jgi:Flp pilus assembly protein TadD